MTKRFGIGSGVAAGAILTHELFHVHAALAFSLKATTMAERLVSVAIAVVLLAILVYAAFRWARRAFFHGFITAAGLILSVDIVLLHWIFQLHRITSGPEADVLEPLFVIAGAALAVIGVRSEVAARKSR